MSAGLRPIPPLARGVFDRDYLSRSRAELFDDLDRDSGARVLPLWRSRTLVDGDAATLLTAAPDEGVVLTCYLGRTITEIAGTPPGSPVRFVVLDDDRAHELEPDESRWLALRDIAGAVTDESASLITAAVALANWHQVNTFCPRCGSSTAIEQAGWSRRCTSCSNEIFPRTDPAVIVVVTDGDDRLLLGSNVLWEQGRYSLLAGFVEAGESLEQAVVREIFEECGLRVTNADYRASQPWPFPRSLMLGFRASVAADQDPEALQPDGDEIVDLRWFSRSELRESREGVLLPGTSSIARLLIEEWLVEDGGPGLDAPVTAATGVRR